MIECLHQDLTTWPTKKNACNDIEDTKKKTDKNMLAMTRKT
jgi:hypothetical protein